MILVDGFNIWGKLANDGTESGPQKDRLSRAGGATVVFIT